MMSRWRRRRAPRHARPSVFTPARHVLPTSAAAFLTLFGLVGWAVVAGAQPAAMHLPAAAPAPLAAVTHSSAAARALPGAGVTDGIPPKLAAAIRLVARQSAVTDSGTTRGASVAAVNDLTEASALAQDGIPVTALRAYQQAAAREHLLRPGCGLTWPLLAGIGRVESDHGRFAGAVLHTDGLSTPLIIGIPLNGHGTALIRDTDNGRLDGDPVYDHAVGPMQFIPSTWASWGVDADHNGVANPFDIFDAAAAAADYLCAAGGDLTTYAGQVRAVRSYNDSDAYISLVLAMERLYAAGAGVVVPAAPGTGAPGPGTKPTLPPVDPGPPGGVGNQHHHHHKHGTHSPSPSPSSSASHSPSHSPPPSSSPAPSSSATVDPSPSHSPSSSTSPSPSHSPSSTPAQCPSSSSSARSPSSASTSSSDCPSTSPSRSRSRSASSSADAASRSPSDTSSDPSS